MVDPTKANDLGLSEFTFKSIGIVESCFKENFGIPRQPGLAPTAAAKIWMLPPYNTLDAFDGVSQSSHLWVQFVFHKNLSDKQRSLKVRPPRLGGSQALGVFATRSPHRPNPIGLSVVKNDGVQCIGDRLAVLISGVDMLDGTPVLDIKPYIPYVDCIPNAVNTLAADPPALLEVAFSDEARLFCDEYKKNSEVDIQRLVREVLSQDPRDRYLQTKTDRGYGMVLMDFDIRWTYLVQDGTVITWVKNLIPV